MKRIWTIVPLAVLLLAWVSCTTVRHVKVDSADRMMSVAPDGSTALTILGYTRSDGFHQTHLGYARFTGLDSIKFYSMHAAPSSPSSTVGVPPKATFAFDFALPRLDVASLDVRRSHALKTVGAIVVAAAAVGLVVAAMSSGSPARSSSTATSCPLVYSWDGTQFVLDAEPYGGATIQALERTDVTELEHLTSSGGRYRLLMTNEMEETQHTNRLELMVVDHAPGMVVAPDHDGMLHAFQTVHRLVDARDQTGRDLRPWLAEKDHATWHPDLGRASQGLPLADTRDHITITFDRPPGTRNAYLLADAATSPWGARMIRPMLEMRGVSLGLFYAAINTNEGARRKLHEWNEREELFYLGVEVEEDGRWVRQGHLIGGGPVVSESRVIPLDLSRVTGDQVRIRVHPPIGFWMFNAFRLAAAEVPVRPTIVAPLGGQDGAGKDVRASLIKEDKAYLTFVGDDAHAIVDFPCPTPVEGTARTVFARTRGWYEIHVRASGFPDLAEIDRVTNQPGYPVEFSLRRFREESATKVAQETGGGRSRSVNAERN